MVRSSLIVLILVFFLGCKTTSKVTEPPARNSDFVLTFGSCNKHTIENLLWDDILELKPDIWVWGGDIVYADTEDMQVLRKIYAAQNEVKGYRKLKSKVSIIGSWDDHDYGVNDGGVEFAAKKESQQEFLNFMGVPQESARRNQEGIYTVHDYEVQQGKIKVIILDTRYFRTAIIEDPKTRRNIANAYGEGTVLGDTQWQWLEETLTNSDADFNIIVSSIQLLSNEHGFETWGNFPHEVDRFKKLIATSKANGTMVLSGDRHISEFSRVKVDELKYPLIDFTSSGLTHAYAKYSGEVNPFRVGEVVFTESFGVVHFNFENKVVTFEMRGNDGVILEALQQQY